MLAQYGAEALGKSQLGQPLEFFELFLEQDSDCANESKPPPHYLRTPKQTVLECHVLEACDR